jgi:hypothetical protein
MSTSAPLGRSRTLLAAVALGLILLGAVPGLGARPARAAADQLYNTRALGMGGALRGAAAGGAGPLMNPSGMSLVQSYTVEAAYMLATARTDHFFHGAIVDSTSGFRLGGGLYYTYHSDNPEGQNAGHGHEAGLALSFPFGEHVALGGTLKYFNLSGDQRPVEGDRQITFDAGATIRATSIVSLGVVGYNLRNLHAAVAPVGLGYGVAVVPDPDITLVVDGVTTLTADAPATRTGTRVMGGGEVLLAKKIAVRLGGGYDGVTQNGFFTAGFSAVSDVGAIDLGIRQDAFQNGPYPRETIAGVSVRLFVPAPPQP